MVNVFLTPEAYAKLKAAKQKGESFSDVVVREVKQQVNLDKYFGALKGMNAEKLSVEIKKERDRSFK